MKDLFVRIIGSIFVTGLAIMPLAGIIRVFNDGFILLGISFSLMLLAAYLFILALTWETDLEQ